MLAYVRESGTQRSSTNETITAVSSSSRAHLSLWLEGLIKAEDQLWSGELTWQNAPRIGKDPSAHLGETDLIRMANSVICAKRSLRNPDGY